MRYIYIVFMLVILSVEVFHPTQVFADDDYVLGPGDVISVNIFNESDMGIKGVRLPKNGVVTFPYIGDLKVNGLTVDSLKKKLIRKLKDGYLKHPQLVISIDEYRKYFVNGQVNNPGGYPYVEGLTIRKAITIAGGITDKASLSKILLLKEGQRDPLRLVRALDKTIGPGDVLTIGESLF